MPTKKFHYHNLGYWFLAFIVLAFAGFYTTYFIRIFEPTPAIIHVHFVLMALWLAMLIAQPFLIKYKKLPLHRLLGKASYLLVPLVLITGFILTRNEYYRKVERFSGEALSGLKPYTNDEILQLAAKDPIAVFYIAWFGIFYLLAIKNRHKSPKHARYMLATALTLTGPTVDRILGIHFGLESIAGISSFIVSFLIIDFILGGLLYLDYKNKRDTRALWTCLLVYFVGQLLYFTLPNFEAWAVFMKFIMLPQP
jgi:hypothetical protein